MTFQPLFSTPMGPVHCPWDSQILLLNNFLIKNMSHGTIHTLKNYFTTMFSIFSFQLYPNEPIIFNLLLFETIRCNLLFLKLHMYQYDCRHINATANESISFLRCVDDLLLKS